MLAGLTARSPSLAAMNAIRISHSPACARRRRYWSASGRHWKSSCCDRVWAPKRRQMERDDGILSHQYGHRSRSAQHPKTGGLPIIRKVKGAIGVSGADTNEQDEECALAALAALNKT